MTEAEFLDSYRNTLEHVEGIVESAIQDHDMDIDYESANDMLTLNFNNGSVAIISRQSAISQLWLAARSGGFHFDYDSELNEWVCTLDGRPFCLMLEEICQEQGGVSLSFA